MDTEEIPNLMLFIICILGITFLAFLYHPPDTDDEKRNIQIAGFTMSTVAPALLLFIKFRAP